jgi:non-canonical purine NTP pyrophosphatase (RdgB/HAM1 family)
VALYFVTGSAHKFAEVKAILPDIEQMEMDLDEIQEIDAHKIIANKLSQARASLEQGRELMVEDTSLYLDALNGLPGPLIKWFMKTVGREGIYKLAQTFNNFGATARTVIGYADEKGVIQFFEGEIKGTIVEPRGDSTFGPFGWDPVFLPDGYTQTFGEMGDEKNLISHRRLAVEKLKTYLQK